MSLLCVHLLYSISYHPITISQYDLNLQKKKHGEKFRLTSEKKEEKQKKCENDNNKVKRHLANQIKRCVKEMFIECLWMNCKLTWWWWLGFIQRTQTTTTKWLKCATWCILVCAINTYRRCLYLFVDFGQTNKRHTLTHAKNKHTDRESMNDKRKRENEKNSVVDNKERERETTAFNYDYDYKFMFCEYCIIMFRWVDFCISNGSNTEWKCLWVWDAHTK